MVDVNGELAGYARTEWADEEDATGPSTSSASCDRRSGGRRSAGPCSKRSRSGRSRSPPTTRPSDPSSSPRRRSAIRAPTRCSRRRATSPFATTTSWSGRTSTRFPTRRCPTAWRSGEVEAEHLRPIWDADGRGVRGLWGFTEPTEADYDWFVTDPVESSDTIALADRLGRRRDRRPGPGVHQPRRERALRREARLGRAHHRPPAVAAARPGAGAHRGEHRRPPRARHDRRRARRRRRRTRAARCASTRASGSSRSAARPRTASRCSRA